MTPRGEAVRRTPPRPRSFHDPGGENVYGVAFSPSRSEIAVSDESSTTADGVVYVWNTKFLGSAGT